MPSTRFTSAVESATTRLFRSAYGVSSIALDPTSAWSVLGFTNPR